MEKEFQNESVFPWLVTLLDPVIAPKKNTPNYRFLTAAKKVAINLYYLKDTGSSWMMANAFGIHQCTVTKVINQVSHAINNVLGPVHLPRDVNEMREKASQFELKFGMTQALGCIDGTCVAIKRPPNSSQDFFNYKQFFSLNVQAVCDSNGYFMDVECKWPGSVHDVKVPKFLQIHSLVKTLTVQNVLLHTFHCYLAMLQYLIILQATQHTH